MHCFLAGVARLERATHGLEGRCSIQLSYTPRERSEHRHHVSVDREKYGVTDGARTHDNRSHSPGLYQLSYDHQ